MRRMDCNLALKKVNYSFPTLIKVGNERITDAAAISSEFNEYFTNIGTKLAESIPVVNSIVLQKIP